MANGILTRSAAGELNMYSPAMNGVFYNSNGSYQYSGAIPSSGFATQHAIVTPTAGMSAQFTSGAAWGGTVNIVGSANAEGTYFYQPAAYENGGNGSVYPPNVNPLPCHIYTFGTPTTPSGYGFFAPGANSAQISVDANHKAYYVHPDANGSVIRSGTCSSMSSSTSNNSSYSQPTSASILFERSFINPPLIFVTESSGPIALNYMTQDGNGKFNGMSVVAASSMSNQGLRGTAPYSGNSYSFSYFLVSDEDPIFGNSADYGMKVFNQSGSKVFDSAFFSPTFQVVTVTKPYGYLSNGSYNTTYSDITKTAKRGVCLNNLNSVTGSTIYTSWIGVGGPFSLFGRYVSATLTNARIQGAGTCGIFRVNTLPQYWWNSFDYTYGSVSNMPILFANYAY